MSTPRLPLRCVVVSFLSSLVCAPCAGADGDSPRYNRDVRPILSNRCFQCHGPDSNTREAGLRLDQRESAVAKLESGAVAIDPRTIDGSELLKRVTATDPDERMPPTGEALTSREVEVLRKWIAAGAAYEKHWSFLAPSRPAVPSLEDLGDLGDARAANPIDHFVYRRLKSAERPPAVSDRPVEAADKTTLIRRVAFDLTGLPPTIAEIDRYLGDSSKQAYAHMVDRYLDSHAYGEHMARHWLDLARYADSNGYQYDTERTQWVWRDWLIHAYNQNMPFDQFTVEQLAGDLLPDATPQQRLATAFNRNHGITIEGGIVDEEYRIEYVMDRLNTTGSVWLGLTVGCARCHDHKFDPLSQKEFYSLFAYFNQVPERGMRGFEPQERIPSPLAAAQSNAVEQQIAKLQQQLDAPLDVESHLAKWVGQLDDSSTGWRVLRPAKYESSGGATLELKPDGSLLATGKNPVNDTYTIEVELEGDGWNAVRLEALTDPSLPANGPGRYSNSNFVLSEFELAITVADGSAHSQPVKLATARADYSQKAYNVAAAIDGNTGGKGGWAVDGPTRKQPATAIFGAAQPFGAAGKFRLTAKLRHQSPFGRHGVGRVRLAVSRGAAASLPFHGIPQQILVVAKTPSNQRKPDEQKQLKDYFLKHHHPRASLQQQIDALRKQNTPAFPATMIMRDAPKRRATFVLDRGQYDAPAGAVEPGVPDVFPSLLKEQPPNRLGFAQWLVDRRHPLTARVAVNRHWQRIFGVGLVKTSEDFGLQGEHPSHPELLDYLAVEFMESGWDVKRLLRTILNSSTYRQTSHVSPEAYRGDPENRWLARGPRMRLDAEEIRDAALAVSGLLKTRIGGPSVYPYQPPGLWLELNNRPGYSKAYPVGSGDALYRRSMYTFWKRTVPSPMLKTFDAPEREFCTLRRSKTNTPLQALLLFNGPQFVEAARHLAARVIRDGGETEQARIQLAFRLVTARTPDEREQAVLLDVLKSQRVVFQKDPAAAERLLRVGASGATIGQDDPAAHDEWAAWTSVCRLILNLNEAITKG